MRSRSRLLCSLLTLALACTHAPAARASNDGKLCDGFNIVLCVPLFLAVGVVQALQPASPYRKLEEAIRDNDLERAKRVVRHADADERLGLLKQVVSDYLIIRDRVDAVRLGLLTTALDDRLVDPTGPAGAALLQQVVAFGPRVSSSQEGPGVRQLALARLFIARGARADTVALGDCGICSTDPEFLGVLMQAGADINRVGRGLSLVNQMVENGKLAEAEGLLALGADANGRPVGGYGLLQRIALRCDMRTAAGCASPAPQSCAEQAVTRARFIVAHGADPEGGTTWELGKCVTPYQQALKMQNTALADALRELGADPEFGARCLAAAARP